MKVFLVPKQWLYLLSGLMWSGVGIVLGSYAYDWLHILPGKAVLLWTLPGIILACLIYFFGFSRLAKQNIRRIQELPENRPSLFCFQKWSSYPLIVFMISLGLYLRIYSPVPKPILGTMYIGIGGGLFSSSIHYYAYLKKNYL
jgi:hypothetical protein